MPIANTSKAVGVLPELLKSIMARRTRIYLWGAAIGDALAWGAYLLAALFNLNVLGFEGKPGSHERAYLVIAVLATLGLGGFVVSMFRKNKARWNKAASPSPK